MTTDLGYVTDRSQGVGGRAPRAYLRTSARTLDLSGTWRFRLCATAGGTGPGFVEDGYDDSGWDALRVPSHWVLEPVTPPGESEPRSLRGTAHGPLYTNTALPIPLDPPLVPTENPTGDHRLVFDVPPEWRRDGSVLRFLGVDSCAMVWLNGTELGHFKGSRLPYEFDVGPVLRPGPNVLAVRVHRWSSGTYLEDQDMWWLPGDLPRGRAAGTAARRRSTTSSYERTTTTRAGWARCASRPRRRASSTSRSSGSATFRPDRP